MPSFHAHIVLRLALQSCVVAADVVLRVLPHPRMVQRRVVRYQVEQQAHAALPQPLPEARERVVAAEIGMNGVSLDREGRAGDVVIRQVR